MAKFIRYGFLYDTLFTFFQNLPWFKSTDRCLNTKFSGQEVVCGKDVNSYIGGEIAIEAKAAMITKDAQFTSIAVNTTHSATVAFVGTLDGRLLKVSICGVSSFFLRRRCSNDDSGCDSDSGNQSGRVRGHRKESVGVFDERFRSSRRRRLTS